MLQGDAEGSCRFIFLCQLLPASSRKYSMKNKSHRNPRAGAFSVEDQSYSRCLDHNMLIGDWMLESCGTTVLAHLMWWPRRPPFLFAQCLLLVDEQISSAFSKLCCSHTSLARYQLMFQGNMILNFSWGPQTLTQRMYLPQHFSDLLVN